jgi:tight adherence protein B
VSAGLWHLAPVLGSIAVVTGVGLAAWVLHDRRATLLLSADGGRLGSVPGLRALLDRSIALTDRLLRRRDDRRLNARLEAAGLALRPAEYVLGVGTATASVLLVLVLRVGPLSALVLASAVPVVSEAWLAHRIARRRTAVAEQLADTLQLLSATLRAGYGLVHSVEVVSQRAPDPTAQEFRRVLIETRLGRSLQDALAGMAARLDVQDLHWVVQAITIHQEVGGDLTHVLETVGGTIREREQIRGQVHALSAEGRLSGIVLLALPVVLALGLAALRPGYLSVLTSHWFGWMMITVGVILLAIGGLWVRRLLRLVY